MEQVWMTPAAKHRDRQYVFTKIKKQRAKLVAHMIADGMSVSTAREKAAEVVYKFWADLSADDPSMAVSPSTVSLVLAGGTP